MTTQQPRWHVAANLGDVDPLNHGGSFVLIDSTGVYDPEVWRYCPESCQFIRFSIRQCHRTAWQQDLYPHPGVGANNYHPNTEEWFGSPEDLSSVASYIGQDVKEFIECLCSHNIVSRAAAYIAICDHWGAANFDSYPDTLTPVQARKLIKRLLAAEKSGRPFNPAIS